MIADNGTTTKLTTVSPLGGQLFDPLSAPIALRVGGGPGLVTAFFAAGALVALRADATYTLDRLAFMVGSPDDGDQPSDAEAQLMWEALEAYLPLLKCLTQAVEGALAKTKASDAAAPDPAKAATQTQASTKDQTAPAVPTPSKEGNNELDRPAGNPPPGGVAGAALPPGAAAVAGPPPLAAVTAADQPSP